MAYGRDTGKAGLPELIAAATLGRWSTKKLSSQAGLGLK